MTPSFFDHLLRTVSLLEFALIPTLGTPEPARLEGSVAPALMHGLGLFGVLALVGYYARRSEYFAARLARMFLLGAALLSLLCSVYFASENQPLGKGVSLVALPLWGGLAALFASLCKDFLEERFRIKPFLGVLVVVLSCAGQYAFEKNTLQNTDAMWWAALSKNGQQVTALDALVKSNIAAQKWDDTRKQLDRCTTITKGGCACSLVRAEVELRARGPVSVAKESAEKANNKCPSPRATAALAESLLAADQVSESEQMSRTELEKTLVTSASKARLRYVHAAALARMGKADEALTEATQASQEGAGRDAHMLIALLTIQRDDLDTARTNLIQVVKDEPRDADAHYNLALISDRRNDYNGAREGYLTALRHDPKLAAARYNLTLLTHKAGAVSEAKNHAKKFVEMFPNDPRGQQLVTLVGGL